MRVALPRHRDFHLVILVRLHHGFFRSALRLVKHMVRSDPRRRGRFLEFVQAMRDECVDAPFESPGNKEGTPQPLLAPLHHRQRHVIPPSILLENLGLQTLSKALSPRS